MPASLLLGPVSEAISPVRTISIAVRQDLGRTRARGLFAYPERLGYWPAAVGLFAFVWLELVYPNSTELARSGSGARSTSPSCSSAAALFGTTFLARADPFEVYSTLVAKLSVWGRRDGVLVVRSPLANLDTVRPRRAWSAVVGVLFGSTAFDSFRESTPGSSSCSRCRRRGCWPDNLALLAFCAGVGAGVRRSATMATGVGERHPATGAAQPVRALGRADHRRLHRRPLPDLLRRVRPADPDPAQRPVQQRRDWLGTADLQVNYWLSYHPTFLAARKVLAVVLGHVLGVIAAHDRAVRILPPRHQLTGQLPLLFAMVAFTVGGLYLLFAA